MRAGLRTLAMGNAAAVQAERDKYSAVFVCLVTLPVAVVVCLSLLCCCLHSRDSERYELRKQRLARQRLARETDGVEREIDILLQARCNQVAVPRSLFT